MSQSEHQYKRIIALSEAIDSWRIFPRLFICFYFWLTYTSVTWFMGLPTPTPEQSAFVVAVITAGAAWFGLYINTKPRANNQPE